MGCVCCCPLTEEEEQARRPILAEESHTPSEPISIQSPSFLGKDAQWTELEGTPADTRAYLTYENEQILRNFCEQIIPHDPHEVERAIVDDWLLEKDKLQQDYFGNIRIENRRRSSMRYSVPEISLTEADRGEIENQTMAFVEQWRVELSASSGEILF